jgi:hypothetical protein
MNKAAPMLILLALLLLARRKEQVTSAVQPGPVVDWWDIWDWTGGML